MIRVVLHEPREVANIAQVVRAMMNFGFSDLALVNPLDYDPWRVAGIAHRSEEFLGRVVVAASLEEALGDCVHAAAFSARGRTAKRLVQRPRDAASELDELASAGTVALVFGREDHGLSNEALDRCHRLVTIPSRPEYPSLNLGHAVALMLYELAMVRGDGALPLKQPRRKAPPAPLEALERLFTDVENTLQLLDFFRTRQRTLIMRSIRHIVQRAGLDEREASLVRAMAIETGRRLAPERPAR